MLNYGQHPLNFLSLQTHSHVPAAEEFAENLSLGTQRAKDCLQQAQQRQKAYADRCRREVTFDVGEQVLLNTKYLRSSSGTPKLMPRWIGPYKVLERIGIVAYKLDLPFDMQKYPVFHVSLLQPWVSSGRLQSPPPRLLLDGQTVWTVDRIIDHRAGARKNLWEFLIRWEGYDKSNDSWEPEAYIHDPQLVQDFGTLLAQREPLWRCFILARIAVIKGTFAMTHSCCTYQCKGIAVHCCCWKVDLMSSLQYLLAVQKTD